MHSRRRMWWNASRGKLLPARPMLFSSAQKRAASVTAQRFGDGPSRSTAHAIDSLAKDPRPDLIFDPECISCHATGFPYRSGWHSPSATPHLAGTQCESCHGPGSRHVSEPNSPAFREPMRSTGDRTRNDLCTKCHDHDNSPKYDLTRYWNRIEHKGLDDYKNPAVHQGVKIQGRD